MKGLKYNLQFFPVHMNFVGNGFNKFYNYVNKLEGVTKWFRLGY